MTRLFVSFYLFMAVSLVLISSTLELIWPGEDYRESADMVLAKALLPLALEDQNQLLEKLRHLVSPIPVVRGLVTKILVVLY